MFVVIYRLLLLLRYIVFAFLIYMPGYANGGNVANGTPEPHLTPSDITHIKSLNAIPPLLKNYDASVTHTCVNSPSNFQHNGDLNIGGLFSIHNFRDGICQEEIDPTNLQMMYAMVYMIKKINANEDILTNVTLGFTMHDYCGDVNVAVMSSMEFIKSTTDCSNTNTGNTSVVQAVIGPMQSDAALSVASLFSLFKLPVISPFATSTDLSDERYSYFLRNVPSDNMQIIALADIVQYFEWSSIGVLSTDDIGYGIRGSELLVDELQARNICVAYQTRFNADFTDSEFDNILDLLRNVTNIKVLVSISNEAAMLKLLDAFARKEMYGYTWLASEGWAWSPMLFKGHYYKVIQGMLGVTVPSYKDPEFKTYLKQLRPDCHDPFLKQYWEQAHNCTFSTRSINNNIFPCTGNESFTSNDPFLADTLVSSVMDSVKVIAYGLQACNSSEPKQLLGCMKNVSFVNELDYRISFQENGDLSSYGLYHITNIQPGNNCLPILPPEVVGTWTEGQGLNIKSAIHWPTFVGSCDQKLTESVNIVTPKSYCSEDCDYGYRQQIFRENKCCWECIPCKKSEYTGVKNALMCLKCNFDEIANFTKNGCKKLPHYFLTPVHNSVALILAIAGVIGIVATLIILMFFVTKRQSTVVYHSCGKHFKFPLLVCILCCFSFASFFISHTTSLSCRIGATIQLLPIVVCQMLLLCTCAVHKFEAKRAKRYNAWIFIMVISSYSCFIAIGYLTNKPGIETHSDYSNEVLIIGCSIKGGISCYTMAFIYVFVLDVIGIIVSYRNRKAEANFNEAKFILYTFISNTMLRITVIFVHALIGEDIHKRHIAIAFGMIFSACIFLACIFFPRLNAYKQKTEARMPQCSKPKRGWKFRRKTNNKARENWNEEALIAKKNILSNIEKTINVIKEDTMQQKRILLLCKEHQRELRQRYSRTETELRNKIQILRNAKEQIVTSPGYVRTTKC